MIRAPLLAAAAIAFSLPVAAPALAQPGAMRAEFAQPFAREQQVIVDGTAWTCADTACSARGDDARPAIACRKLSRKVGPVARFATAQGELDAAGLAACNQDHK
jgi:hypothetical protein